MSHPMYNARGGPFSSGQRSVVSGQYSLGSQSGLDLGGARLGSDSISGSRGAMMVNQQMTFPLGQRQSQVSQALDATIDMNIREAREEVRLLTQMLQQPKAADPRVRKDIRDEVLSSGAGGYAPTSVPGRSDDVDWTCFQAPSKLFAPQSLGQSSSSSQLFQSSGFGGPSGLDSQPPAEHQPTRYTSESASSILASFQLSIEDLELLSHYPDDQLTPDNLPFILRDIRMRKAKRSVPEPDMRSSSDLMVSETRQSKVIDYGHSSKLGFPDEKPDSYARDHRNKESSNYGREVSRSPFQAVDMVKHSQQKTSATVPSQASVMLTKLQQTQAMDPRSTSQSLEMQGVKTIPGRLPTSTPISSSISRPPQIPALLGNLGQMATMVSGGPKLSWPPAFPPPPMSVPSSKRLPTPTMMNDYSAATPRIFPHTCSLCNIECVQIKDWIEHQNTNLHIENCRRLRKQYPDWSVEAIPVTRTEPKLERRSPKRHTRSHSYSRTPSPKRHHVSSSRRQRSRSRSRSPRRYRRSRTRSRSSSPLRKTRAASPSFRRRSRSPPGHRSRSPAYSGRRSPVRSSRRASPRRSSPPPRRNSPPPRQQRQSSSERLAKKLLESSAQLSSVTSSSSLKAVVESLAPALLAELAKKRSTSSSTVKGSSSTKRSSSPPSKRSESSKTSSSSATKSTSKNGKPKKATAGPGTSCLLRLRNIPHGTTYEEITSVLKPYGKIYTSILLKAIGEASVCMEREEDAKVLVNCKTLRLRGKLIDISMEKSPQTPTESTKSTKVKQTAKTKTSIKGEPSVLKSKIIKKEIPWKRNIVEITGLPEAGVSEDDLSNLANPHGCISPPLIAVTQQKAYLEMRDTEAAEALVKAYATTPAKLQDKEITITMMTQPIDLNYTESIFRVLMGMDKLPTQELAALPERLLIVGNVPKGLGAITEVQKLIKRFGTYKQVLPLNNRVIFEMETTAIARAVHSRFLKFPCIVQNNSLIFKLAKLPKATDQVKKKPDAKGTKPAAKVAVKVQPKAKSTKAHTPKSTNTPTTAAPPLTSGSIKVAPASTAAEVVTVKTENNPLTDTTESEAKIETDNITSKETLNSETAAVLKHSECDTVMDVASSETPQEISDIKLAHSAIETASPESSESKIDVSVTATNAFKSTTDTEAQIGTQEGKTSPTVMETQESESEVSVLPQVASEEVTSMNTTDCTENASTDTPEHTDEASLKTSGHDEELSLNILELPQDIADTKAGSMSVEQDESENGLEHLIESPSVVQTVLVGSNDDAKITMGTSEVLEAQNAPMEISDHDTQGDSEPRDTIPENEVPPDDDVKVTAPDQIEITLPASDQSQLSDEVQPQPAPVQVDDVTLDFPPVTQEILKALEAAVHQCRLQSSLRRAEEEAKQKTETEKNATEKVVGRSLSSSLSKKPTVSDNLQPAKKAVHSDNQKAQLEKGKKPHSSGSRSQHGDTESAEGESFHRHKGKGGAEDGLAAVKHGGSSSCSAAGSRKTKLDGSPVSKRSKESEEDGCRSRSTSRSLRSSRSRSKTRKTEKVKEEEEMEEEPFPFNLDEFVTVDEVGDEADEHSPSSSEPPSSLTEAQDDLKAPTSTPKSKSSSCSASAVRSKQKSVSGTVSRRTRSAAAAELEAQRSVVKEPAHAKPVTEMKELEKVKAEESPKAEADAATSDGSQEGEPTEAEERTPECLCSDKSTAEASPTEDKNKEGNVQRDTEDLCLIKKENAENKLPESNQVKPSCPVLNNDPLLTSKIEESDIAADNQSDSSLSGVHQMENKDEEKVKLSLLPDLHSKGALETLDEVSEEEEDFPDEAEEEELLKRQAGEDPEALLTVDEVGGDEGDAEEEQLEKELQGLVTLDEIVEDDYEEDSFNPETLVTLDEARGDDEEMDEKELDKCKQSGFEVETPAKPEEPMGSSGLDEEACEMEELRRMNFVTVDEVGAEDEEVEEDREVQKAVASVARKDSRLKKRALKGSVRKSTRGKKGSFGNKLEETPEMPTVEAPASVSPPSSVTEPVDTDVESELQNLKMDLTIGPSATREKPGVVLQENEVVCKETRANSPTTEKRVAIKEESKQRLESEEMQEPESKRPRSESSINNDFSLPPFSPQNPIGLDFVVPKTGFYCKLCCLFYGSEETAKKIHCSSLRHYENMQKFYEKLKSQSGSSTPRASSNCASD